MTKAELQRINYALSTQLKAYIHCYENCSAELHELKMKHDTKYAKRYCGDCGKDMIDSQYGLICGNCRLQV